AGLYDLPARRAGPCRPDHDAGHLPGRRFQLRLSGSFVYPGCGGRKGHNAMIRSAAFLAACLLSTVALAQPPGAIDQRVERVLRETPIIDGHNDLPWELRTNYGSRVQGLDADTSRGPHPLETDIPRLRAGHVGGQFWSVWIPTS